MWSARWVRGLLMLMALCVGVAMLSRGLGRRVAAEGQSGGTGAKGGSGRGAGALRERITFRFEIADMVTNHQLEGQRNTFHVEYEYAGQLKGAGYDLQGHAVATDTYPYFQAVRQDIIGYVKEYSDKKDFYELFGTNICRFVLGKYPQIRKIRLTIDIPGYKEIDVDRSEVIEVGRE